MRALSPADAKLTKEFVRLFTGRDMMGAMSLKPAELSGFYMVGQWIIPFSGTVMAALSGRQLIQLLCNLSGKPFMTSLP